LNKGKCVMFRCALPGAALTGTPGIVLPASGQDGFLSGLGDLSGGGFASRARAISADGSVIVGWSLWATDEEAEAEAFRGTRSTGMLRLGFLPGGNAASLANAVSPNGSIVAGDSFDAYSGDRLRGCRWTPETGMVRLDPDGNDIELAYGISADGRVIVGKGEGDLAGARVTGLGDGGGEADVPLPGILTFAAVLATDRC
jgi:hypothetical protein